MENILKSNSTFFLTSKNGFDEVKKAFKSQIGTYMISVIRETKNSIEFVYRGYECFISDNGGELNIGVRNIAYSYHSIPVVFNTSCDIIVPHLIVMLVMEYISVMLEKFKSFNMKAYSKIYSNKIRLDFVNKVFRKYIQPEN